MVPNWNWDKPFQTDSTYEKDIMDALPLTGNLLCKEGMEHHGKFGHPLGRIHHIAIMRRIVICYTAWLLITQTAAPTIPGLQGLKRCIQYLSIHPHRPIFNPSSSYYVSNFIRLTWIWNQVEDYTTNNFLEFHQDSDNDIILNMRRSVSGIINTILGVKVFWKKNPNQLYYLTPLIEKVYACKSIMKNIQVLTVLMFACSMNFTTKLHNYLWFNI